MPLSRLRYPGFARTYDMTKAWSLSRVETSEQCSTFVLCTDVAHKNNVTSFQVFVLKRVLKYS